MRCGAMKVTKSMESFPRRTCVHQKGINPALKADLLIVHNLEALAVSENKQNALIIKLERT
jgi:hypothetical protein